MRVVFANCQLRGPPSSLTQAKSAAESTAKIPTTLEKPGQYQDVQEQVGVALSI